MEEVQSVLVDSGEQETILAYVKKLNGAVREVDEWLGAARRDGNKVGFYGASVGASNLLSLLDCSDIDLGLYDGDIAKQGAYLPGSSLQIRSPEGLLHDELDKVLILPVNYADAITKFLRAELHLPCSVEVRSLAQILASKSGDA